MHKYRHEIKSQMTEEKGIVVQPYTAGRDFRYIIAKQEPYLYILQCVYE